MADVDLHAARELLADFSSQAMLEMRKDGSTSFASEMSELSVENVFARLWLRPGLDRRSRSLLTLGILIALGSTDEIKVHTIIALKNGLTVAEIEEIIYHATGYAGFPRANSARAAATEALRLEGVIA